MTTRVHLISGPRNLSTALMYSFRSRADTTVVDEPLYGHYLRVTGIDHPGRDDVLATEETDGARAITDTILGPCDTAVLFLKSMGHHTVGVGLDLAFLERVTNVFLTREPEDMLSSLTRQLPNPTVEMTGLAQQVELVKRITEGGATPIVIDSKNLLLDPPGVLRRLCGAIGIPWDEAMLEWPAGPKPEDGVWAPYWYGRLHRTTGFEPYRPTGDPLTPHLDEVLAECRRLYARLAPFAIRAEVQEPG